MNAVARTIRLPARHEETGQPFIRIRQRQESVAHGRGAEPFVAGEDVATLPVRHGAGRVGAHIAAALLLRHRHADGDTGFPVCRKEVRIVGGCLHARTHFSAISGVDCSAGTQA